jgi:NAD(P)H-hydrate epimerase
MTAVDELRREYGALTSDDVAALDRAAGETGVSVVQLMEIAGWQIARCTWHLLHEQPARVLVLAGRGNNGGDGLVAARHLATWGCDVVARIFREEENLSVMVAGQVRAARANGVVVKPTFDPAAAVGDERTARIALDGILGTGLRSAPRDLEAAVITGLNESGHNVLAIDVPSGLNATATCTLAAMKAGLWSEGARAFSGDIWLADIGIPAAAWSASGIRRPSAARGGALVPVPSATRS